ncbi:hypothetical protein MIMGU_mgv1a0249451mg, partial [Erythranthe guttata]
ATIFPGDFSRALYPFL